MSQRTRGSETTLQVIIDGDLKSSSWAKVLDWTITPKQEIQETGFQGELEDDYDFSHHGFGIDFSLQELDNSLRTVLFDFVNREVARSAYPDIQIVITIKHRAGLTETIVCENVVFKFDSLASAAKKDFVQTKISGMFKKMSPQ
jgi:hypothetical protein